MPIGVYERTEKAKYSHQLNAFKARQVYIEKLQNEQKEIVATEIELAWAAGFIEGEGCISINKKSTIQKSRKYNYYSLSLSVGQINPAPLKLLHSMFGGHLLNKTKQVGRRPAYTWNINSRACYSVLQKIYPYMASKRNEIEIALKFQSLTNRSGVKGTPPEIKLEMEFLYEQMKKAHNLIWDVNIKNG